MINPLPGYRSHNPHPHRGKNRSANIDLLIIGRDPPVRMRLDLDIDLRRHLHAPDPCLAITAASCRILDLMSSLCSECIDESETCG